MTVTLLLTLLALSAPPTAGVPEAPSVSTPLPAEDVATLLATLQGEKDDVDPDVIARLAELGTEAALRGLFEAYEVMGSVYMRRAVMRGVAHFDGVPKLSKPALQFLSDVATAGRDRNLRHYAVELLADFASGGRTYLQLIVESEADQEVRELALERHVAAAVPADHDWYRRLYTPMEADDERGQRRDDDATPERRTPASLRRMAFAAMPDWYSDEELLEAVRDRDGDIVVMAMREMHRRDHAAVLETAERLYTSLDRGVRNPRASDDRLAAARILAARLDPKEVGLRFVKHATQKAAREDMVLGLAEIVAGLSNKDLEKALAKKLGKGSGLERLFYVLACRKLPDARVRKAYLKLLKDRDERVACAALDVLAERNDHEAAEAMRKLLEKSKSPDVVAHAMSALCKLGRDDEEWGQRLRAYVDHEDRRLRNTALRNLGLERDPANLELLGQALQHPHWSTRLEAARGLEALRSKAAVGLLIEQLGADRGRMVRELAEILWRLTGQPFGRNARVWAHWWREEGAGFTFPTEAQFKKLEAEREVRELKERSRTLRGRGSKGLSMEEQKFFGIRIDSHRVVFVLDVSGSMDFPVREGDRDGEDRMQRARIELKKAFDGLEASAFFNLVTFSDRVFPWREEMVTRTPEALAEAKAYLDELRPDGGTNLYGGMQAAFEHPDVDTIFLVSDGEPSMGDIVDPEVIRSRIRTWNEDLGIVIHCISVGAELEILRLIAEDADGVYLEFR